MAGSTRWFGLAFFDFGDDLAAPLNVQKEIDRFVLIDKQLYGIYSIFGNGVINGWEIQSNGFDSSTGISAIVTDGLGIISRIAAQTTFPSVINGIPPNSRFGIYARLLGSTVRNREVDFFASAVDPGGDTIKIGTVTTGASGIADIDNDDRTVIGFKQIIKEEIDKHRHRGTPSKIDLKEETKNQLPGARIEGVPTEKITSGVLDIERLPIIDHDQLDFSGLLSHAALDSFVKTLTKENKELLGEITTTNLLKLIIFLKYIYGDVDEHFVNELAIIPGISPNSFLDFEASSAYIDLQNKCISGKPPASGEFLDLDLDSQLAFSSASTVSDVEATTEPIPNTGGGDGGAGAGGGGAGAGAGGGSVGDDGPVISSASQSRVLRLPRDQTAADIIADFEGATANGAEIPGIETTVDITSSEVGVFADSADLLKTEGAFGGKFSAKATPKALYTINFPEKRDWTLFDELVVPVKALDDTHPAVRAYFVSYDSAADEEVVSETFLILAEDEVPEIDDSSNFAEKTFDITGINRRCVTKFVIEVDGIEAFDFYLDNIRVRNASLYKPSGTIRYRYSSASPLIFHSIFYEAYKPENTNITVRMRAANSSALLSRAQWTPNLPSGTVVALPGTDAEIEIILQTNDPLTTPAFANLKLRLLADSEDHGFVLDGTSDFEKGTSDNVTIEEGGVGGAQVRIGEPINIDGLYFSLNDFISEIDSDDRAVSGFSGPNMPISPVQAVNWRAEPFRKFDNAVNVVRTNSRTFIIADRDNDRVLEVGPNGKFIRGFGTPHVTTSTLWPMSAVLNPQTGILSFVVSKEVDRESFDLTTLSLYIGDTEIPLTKKETIVSRQTLSRLIEINLSPEKISQISNSGSAADYWLAFRFDSFAEEIVIPPEAQGLYGINGIPVFYGDFRYVNFIRRPICVDKFSNGNWVVCNATLNRESVNIPGAEDIEAETSASTEALVEAPSVIEFNPENPDSFVFSYNDIKFSDYSLGGIKEYENNRIAIAGVFPSSEALSGGNDSNALSEVDKTISVSIVDDNGDPLDPSSIVLESQGGDFGVRRNDNNAVVVDSGTDPIRVGRGEYQFTFSATLNVSYTWSWKIVREVGGDEEFRETTEIITLENSSGDKALALALLQGHRGRVTVVDRGDGRKLIEYISSDGLYPSDVDVYDNGSLLIAESDFSGRGGRLIQINTFGNIIWQYSNGRLGVINDVALRTNNNIVISL